MRNYHAYCYHLLRIQIFFVYGTPISKRESFDWLVMSIQDYIKHLIMTYYDYSRVPKQFSSSKKIKYEIRFDSYKNQIHFLDEVICDIFLD